MIPINLEINHILQKKPIKPKHPSLPIIPNNSTKPPNLVLLNISIMLDLRVVLIRFGAKNRF